MKEFDHTAGFRWELIEHGLGRMTMPWAARAHRGEALLTENMIDHKLRGPFGQSYSTLWPRPPAAAGDARYSGNNGSDRAKYHPVAMIYCL